MIPKEVVEAAEAIKKFEKNDNPDACEQIDFNNVNCKRKTIHHMDLLNALAKFISFVRMPAQSKEIMLSKITHPGLKNMEIALQRGMRVQDVDSYEDEGKRRTIAALNSYTIQDAINKFNTERSVEAAVKNIKTDDKIIGGNKLD